MSTDKLTKDEKISCLEKSFNQLIESGIISTDDRSKLSKDYLVISSDETLQNGDIARLNICESNSGMGGLVGKNGLKVSYLLISDKGLILNNLTTYVEYNSTYIFEVVSSLNEMIKQLSKQ